jgi:hypothetical protein
LRFWVICNRIQKCIVCTSIFKKQPQPFPRTKSKNFTVHCQNYDIFTFIYFNKSFLWQSTS